MAGSVLIVDDEPRFGSLARELLALKGFTVAGVAGDGDQALRMARTLRPSVVLVDINLPDVSGLELARTLRRLPGPPRVLLTSADVDVSESVVRDCGACAFVPKDELPSSDIGRLLGA